MTQGEFRRRHQESWSRLESMLDELDGGRRILSAADVVDLADFDREYRRVCKHLALARQRLYGTVVVQYLNDLTLRANRQFYGQKRRFLPSFARFVLGGFPALVRAHAGVALASTALFVLPLLGVVAALVVDPDRIHLFMPAGEIRSFEEMYAADADYRAPERAADSDLLMFGHYISNNIGVGFRAFAGGIMFGLGSIYYMVLNGLQMGAVATHLAQIGYGSTFFPFVVGHSGPELVAIVLAGAAGLNLGWGILAPGRLTRVESLKQAAAQSVGIVCGVAGLLVLAACIEAFWSPRANVPDVVKYVVGAALWALTLSYLIFAGRHHEL